MTDHRAQTDRIKEKLERARTSDPELREFGASEHGYLIGPPLTDEEVTAFEKAFEVTLPGCYRAYLARVRNDIPIDNGCAPGPGCGLYPLDQASPYGDHLDIGHQADARVSAIIVRGAQAGRVIRRDGEGIDESYLYRASTFLGWYEGWLDEILPDSPT